MPDQTMRAVRYHDYGGPEVLVVGEAPRPKPKPGEVLVRVHAAGVNPVDWKIRKGYMKAAAPLQFPSTPGFDVAGTVEAIGEGVAALHTGQAIFGRGSGTYAEYAIANANQLAPKPSTLSFEQAAAVNIGAVTAWAGLFDAARLQPGQQVLISGAAGGVGHFAVQLARWKGARVVGTSSAANIDYVRTLGAEKALDYRTMPPASLGRTVDVVFDTVGGEAQAPLWDALKPDGIFVTIAGRITEETAKQHGARTAGVSAKTSTELLQTISGLVDSGLLIPHVGRVFPLDQAAAAHALSEQGHGRGRIVLKVR
jgi:NADPH:quinone reductase-like Zn-dependent oxidoreductase